MKDLTPKEVVEALDKHIVGQDEAKKAVAVAIRNRWRRRQLPEDIRDEVGPKNIIMIGPTGVGKTEIARRLANLVNAPFIKVEASKYTEVGYHGRDVESMVRDLVDRAIHMIHEEQTEVVRVEAERRTEERLLDALIPAGDTAPAKNSATCSAKANSKTAAWTSPSKPSPLRWACSPPSAWTRSTPRCRTSWTG